MRVRTYVTKSTGNKRLDLVGGSLGKYLQVDRGCLPTDFQSSSCQTVN